MIHESAPWKAEIERHRALMEKWSAKDNQRACFYLERGIFISSFVIRKLIECNKLSDDIRLMKLIVQFHKSKKPYKGTIRGFLGNIDIENAYDLENPSESNILLIDLVNRLIHSKNLLFENDSNGSTNKFYFNSDRKIDQEIYRIEVKIFIEILRAVVADNIVSARFSFENEKIVSVLSSGH